MEAKTIEKTSNEGLRSLQLETLNILKSISNSFEERGLRYYLCCGTLIGAIRHKGFIPWDDDIDIAMPRNDYEILLKERKRIIKEPYVLNFYRDSDEKSFIDCHIRIENPNVSCEIERNGVIDKQQIWIDVFPIDGISSNKISQTIMMKRLRILDILLRLSRSVENGIELNKNRSFVEKIGIFLNNTIQLGKLFKTDQILCRMDQILLLKEYDNSECVFILTEYYKKCIYEKKWFGGGKKERFEDLELYIPEDADSVLKKTYGNYMCLPPQSEQKPKHTITVHYNIEG